MGLGSTVFFLQVGSLLALFCHREERYSITRRALQEGKVKTMGITGTAKIREDGSAISFVERLKSFAEMLRKERDAGQVEEGTTPNLSDRVTVGEERKDSDLARMNALRRTLLAMTEARTMEGALEGRMTLPAPLMAMLMAGQAVMADSSVGKLIQKNQATLMIIGQEQGAFATVATTGSTV